MASGIVGFPSDERRWQAVTDGLSHTAFLAEKLVSFPDSWSVTPAAARRQPLRYYWNHGRTFAAGQEEVAYEHCSHPTVLQGLMVGSSPHHSVDSSLHNMTTSFRLDAGRLVTTGSLIRSPPQACILEACYLLFADGHVEMISLQIDRAVFRSLGTIAGQETRVGRLSIKIAGIVIGVLLVICATMGVMSVERFQCPLHRAISCGLSATHIITTRYGIVKDRNVRNPRVCTS